MPNEANAALGSSLFFSRGPDTNTQHILDFWGPLWLCLPLRHHMQRWISTPARSRACSRFRSRRSGTCFSRLASGHRPLRTIVQRELPGLQNEKKRKERTHCHRLVVGRRQSVCPVGFLKKDCRLMLPVGKFSRSFSELVQVLGKLWKASKYPKSIKNRFLVIDQ